MKRELLPIALISCLLLAGPCYANRRSIKGQVKPEEPATQPAPTPPPTLEQTPASPPQVTFRDGELTIAATNSTLADILKAVRTQTGAEVDVPGNPIDRVVGQFGPGPARDVLSSLLNGSHFNYVLLGSATNPNALDRVILMAKSAAQVEQSAAPEQANAGYAPERPGMVSPMSAPGFAAQAQAPAQGAAADADSDSDDTQDADAEDASDDSDSDTDQSADDADQTQDQQQGVAAEDNSNGQQGVKTPEQLLQELQQQQQNQQQQGTPPVGPRGFPPGVPGVPGGQLPH